MMSRSWSWVAAALAVTVGCTSCAAADRAGQTPPAASAPSSTSSTPSTSFAAPPTTAPNAAPTGLPGDPRGGVVTGVTTSDPSLVAAAVATTLYTWDVRLDRSPQDAARRATAWMTPAEAARNAAAVTGGGGATWLALAAHDGWTTASASPDTEPPPPVTAGATARRVLVTVTTHTVDGTTLPAQSKVVLVALTHAGNGEWLADRVIVQSTGGGS